MYNNYNGFSFSPNYGGMGLNNYSNYYRPGLFASLASGLRNTNWSSFINSTQKTLNVVNQAIPLINQAKPLWNNTKTMFKIMGAVKGNNTNRYEERKEPEIKETENKPKFFI